MPEEPLRPPQARASRPEESASSKRLPLCQVPVGEVEAPGRQSLILFCLVFFEKPRQVLREFSLAGV